MDKEKQREYDKRRSKTQIAKTKKWIENNRERYNLRMREYYQRNKIKQKARFLARKIPIPKGQLCQICNIALATERDHRDYSKPLEILFVCKRCNEDLPHVTC